jgi:hypothetical protein
MSDKRGAFTLARSQCEQGLVNVITADASRNNSCARHTRLLACADEM